MPTILDALKLEKQSITKKTGLEGHRLKDT
jgi:hypothetical protein